MPDLLDTIRRCATNTTTITRRPRLGGRHHDCAARWVDPQRRRLGIAREASFRRRRLRQRSRRQQAVGRTDAAAASAAGTETGGGRLSPPAPGSAARGTVANLATGGGGGRRRRLLSVDVGALRRRREPSGSPRPSGAFVGAIRTRARAARPGSPGRARPGSGGLRPGWPATAPQLWGTTREHPLDSTGPRASLAWALPGRKAYEGEPTAPAPAGRFPRASPRLMTACNVLHLTPDLTRRAFLTEPG